MYDSRNPPSVLVNCIGSPQFASRILFVGSECSMLLSSATHPEARPRNSATNHNGAPGPREELKCDPQLRAWIREARGGSSEALGRLLANCQCYLIRVASQVQYASLRPKFDPADLVQDTALDAHRHFAQFKGEAYGELLAWLRQILVNKAATANRRFLRTTKRELSREQSLAPSQTELIDGNPNPHDSLERWEQLKRLEQCLAALPADMRRVILLRVYEHLSYTQIGARLGRSSEAARKLFGRATARLRRLIYTREKTERQHREKRNRAPRSLRSDAPICGRVMDLLSRFGPGSAFTQPKQNQ